jgi:integrase
MTENTRYSGRLLFWGDVTPHVLRHTCATWALWKGKTIWEVAGLIGADASTVERTYGHHRTEQLEEKRA